MMSEDEFLRLALKHFDGDINYGLSGKSELDCSVYVDEYPIGEVLFNFYKEIVADSANEIAELKSMQVMVTNANIDLVRQLDESTAQVNLLREALEKSHGRLMHKDITYHTTLLFVSNLKLLKPKFFKT